jgi:hypothetical protein
LDVELRKGHVQVCYDACHILHYHHQQHHHHHYQIDQWLKRSALPRLLLPEICGYIPLVKFLAKGLRVRPDDSMPSEL